jgi:hypothetical protein
MATAAKCFIVDIAYSPDRRQTSRRLALDRHSAMTARSEVPEVRVSDKPEAA